MQYASEFFAAWCAAAPWRLRAEPPGITEVPPPCVHPAHPLSRISFCLDPRDPIKGIVEID